MIHAFGWTHDVGPPQMIMLQGTRTKPPGPSQDPAVMCSSLIGNRLFGTDPDRQIRVGPGRQS